MLLGLLFGVSGCLAVLVFSLPKECWAAVRMNCRRLDGSFSIRRFRRELHAFYDYATTLAVPALLSFLVFFVAATFLFSYVIPLDLARESLSKFELDGDAWRANLVQTQQEHREFLVKMGIGEEGVQDIQGVLWRGWAFFAVVVLFCLIAALILFIRCAARSVEILATGIRHRREMYAESDVRRMKAGRSSGNLTGR